MDRRSFLTATGSVAAVTIASATTLSAKADALEHAMSEELDRRVVTPAFCNIGDIAYREPGDNRPFLQGDDPRLPKMPERPTLLDFYQRRFAPANHVLQSAALAQKAGYDEKIVLACLLHDIAVTSFIRTDHGYWTAQLVEPYVDEEISWAIRHHQALRFFADDSVGYEYPEAYIRFFGADYKPEPYIHEAHKYALNHKWYMTSRLITVNDLYSFEPDVQVSVEEFTDVIGRHFRQPREGLGFDGSPVAHMWRSMIWPNNFL
ncbi:MAG: hypothetical protein O7F71_20515 [Gammaproteobacteria bacterium]|nr:hypothetical protein [Gammaproteobacteria bacterium]